MPGDGTREIKVARHTALFERLGEVGVVDVIVPV